MPSCPEQDQLRELEAGELADDRANAVLAHVLECPTCAKALEAFRTQCLDSRVIRAAVRMEVSAVVEEDATPSDAGTDVAFQAGHTWDIPDYQRVRLCGEGAYGTVWAVKDRVGVFRALKAIDLGRLRSAAVRCRESTALEAYCRHVEKHPNLIQVFHVGVRGDTLYYTMELADDAGGRKPVRDNLPEHYRPLTLQDVLSSGSVRLDTAVEVVIRLLRGLFRLHAVGLAHRDIKPANIVFIEGQPKLADIGMITTNTATPSQVGTPDYMPPDKRMDFTADTYALGRVLYELVVPEASAESPSLPESLSETSDNWDLDRLNKVLATACAPVAEERYQHAGRMLEDLEACRSLPYDSLFAELDEAVSSSADERRSPYIPLGVAAIGAAPWCLALLLAILLVAKLL